MPTPQQSLYPVANHSNRTNSAGMPVRSPLAKTSLQLTNVIPAKTGDTPGSLTLSVAGNQFYLIQTTAPLKIRPVGGQSVGSFTEYGTGQGMDLDLVNSFTSLEFSNDTENPIVFTIFAGFDSIIDKRLILVNPSTPQVVYPTYPVANAATAVAITDRSGQEFSDINGNAWYALYRVAICIGNPDTGVTLLLQAAGSVVADGPAIMPIYPQTSLRLDIQGDYSLNLGGATINAIVSEIYAAVRKTT